MHESELRGFVAVLAKTKHDPASHRECRRFEHAVCLKPAMQTFGDCAGDGRGYCEEDARHTYSIETDLQGIAALKRLQSFRRHDQFVSGY